MQFVPPDTNLPTLALVINDSANTFMGSREEEFLDLVRAVGINTTTANTHKQMAMQAHINGGSNETKNSTKNKHATPAANRTNTSATPAANRTNTSTTPANTNAPAPPTAVTHRLNLKAINPKFLIGKGQMERLQDIVARNGIKQLALNLDIEASHHRNLTEALNIPVFDRTSIILELFAQRARSYEGKLQVEMAQINYMMSRLVRGWTHLERQRSGIGMRGGPGEKQLELDRRLLSNRAKQLRKRMDKIKKQRELSRSARKKAGLPVVSLVGYTNAGKSSLFNLLTASNALASSQLFATLDPTIRKCRNRDGSEFLIADTVGLIESLSSELTLSFAATFGEINNSDLLLHVVDLADKNSESKQEAVNKLLDELGIKGIPTIMVYNKVDMINFSYPSVIYNKDGFPGTVWVSSKKEYNIDILKQSIKDIIGTKHGQRRYHAHADSAEHAHTPKTTASNNTRLD